MHFLPIFFGWTLCISIIPFQIIQNNNHNHRVFHGANIHHEGNRYAHRVLFKDVRSYRNGDEGVCMVNLEAIEYGVLSNDNGLILG